MVGNTASMAPETTLRRPFGSAVAPCVRERPEGHGRFRGAGDRADRNTITITITTTETDRVTPKHTSS